MPNTALLHPDVTGDGKVTIADYRRWKDHRTDLGGAGSGSSVTASVSAPEPNSSVMLVIGSLVMIACASRAIARSVSG